MGKLNEIAQKAYECAVRRGKIDPDNDSNNNLHRDLLEEVAEVFECTGEKSPHIKEYLDVEEELADVIIVALSTLHHFKCDIDSLIEAKICFKAKAFSACAVMCGRSIEGVCKHHDPKTKTLAGGLKKLLAGVRGTSARGP